MNDLVSQLTLSPRLAILSILFHEMSHFGVLASTRTPTFVIGENQDLLFHLRASGGKSSKNPEPPLE